MDQLRYKGRIPGLDVLRGIAIFMVVIYHGIDGRAPYSEFAGLTRYFVYLTSWGAAGVHLFYVLSGFLITGIIVDSTSPTFYRDFYRRRALRILPAYLLVLVALKLLGLISWNFVIASLLFIANMASLVGGRSSEYGPLWSLAVEEQFYLLWPWVVRRCTVRFLNLLIPVICIAALAMAAILALYFPQIDFKYKLWGNAPWLLAGAFVATLLRGNVLRADNVRFATLALFAASLVTLPLVFSQDFGHHIALLDPFYRVPFVLIFLAFLLLVLSRNEEQADKPGMLFRVFEFLGYLSYGLYLIHQLVFTLYDRAVANTWLAAHDITSVLIGYVVCLLVSVGIAYVSRRYFEEYFLSLPRRPVRTDARARAGSLTE